MWETSGEIVPMEPPYYIVLRVIVPTYILVQVLSHPHALHEAAAGVVIER